MRKGRYTEEEEAFVRSHYSHMSPKTIAKRLGRTVTSVHEKAGKLGLKHGVPKGYVAIRSVVVNQPATRHIAAVAKREGVLRQARSGHRLLCVPERWLDAYLERRMAQMDNEALAQREGWYSVKDIAEALGVDRNAVSVYIGTGRGRVGKAMRGVARIQGGYGRYYYEPQGTRLALAKLGVHVHRRAA